MEEKSPVLPLSSSLPSTAAAAATVHSDWQVYKRPRLLGAGWSSTPEFMAEVLEPDRLYAFSLALCRAEYEGEEALDLPWEALLERYFAEGRFQVFDHMAQHHPRAITGHLCHLLAGRPELLVYQKMVVHYSLQSTAPLAAYRILIEDVIPDAGCRGDIDTLNLLLQAEEASEIRERHSLPLFMIIELEQPALISPQAFFALDQRFPEETSNVAETFAKMLTRFAEGHPDLVTAGLAEAILCSPRQGDVFRRELTSLGSPFTALLTGAEAIAPTNHEFGQLFDGASLNLATYTAWKKRPHYHPRQLWEGRTLVQHWLTTTTNDGEEFWRRLVGELGMELSEINFFAEFLLPEAALAFFASLAGNQERRERFVASQGGRLHPNLFLTFDREEGGCIVPLLVMATRSLDLVAIQGLLKMFPPEQWTRHRQSDEYNVHILLRSMRPPPPKEEVDTLLALIPPPEQK